MTVRFNSALLFSDFVAVQRRKRITLNKAATRADVHFTTLKGLEAGTVRDITVTTLARMLDFMGETDISKYIYNDGTRENE